MQPTASLKTPPPSPNSRGRLAIIEVQPQGDYEPPDGGTLYRIDANHREYEAFGEPQSALCAKPVKVWIAVSQMTR